MGEAQVSLDLVLTDTNLVSIKGAPEFERNKASDQARGKTQANQTHLAHKRGPGGAKIGHASIRCPRTGLGRDT